MTMGNLKVGAKIKELRLAHKDTLKALAEKLNYDYSNLSKVERGVYTPSIGLLKKITEVYDVDPNYFFGDDFTPAEGKVLLDEELNPSELKNRFRFEVDGQEVTDEELEKAIKLIRMFREG